MTGLILDRTTAPRNAFPEWKPYVYQGTGEDTLTAHVIFPDDEPAGKPWLQPCGTVAAYRRHLRAKEPPCPDCAQAGRLRETARHKTYAPYATHENFGGKPRCGAVAAQVLAEPGQEITCKRCQAYAEEAEVTR